MRYLLGVMFLYCVCNKMARHRRRGGEESESDEEKQEVAPADQGEVVQSTTGLDEMDGGRKRRSRRRTLRLPKGKQFKAKTLKRVLRKAGLKTTGKKSTLRARARKAHLIRGGGLADTAATV